jgi:thiol-disulfide isomerase/thioredoxin
LTTLKEDGTFKTEFQLPSGYYRINDMNESTTVYFGDRYDLNLTLDTDSFDESINYTGYGSEANNYLAKKALMEESWGKLNYYGYYCKLEEVPFLKLSDSLYQVSKSRLQTISFGDKDFPHLEFNSVALDNIYRLKTYPGAHRILTKNKSYLESENYPDPFQGLNINNEKLIVIPGYARTISDKFYINRDTSEYRKTGDYGLYIMQKITDNISNERVKQEVAFNFCRNNLTSSTRMDECYAIYKSIETDPKRLKLIEDKYTARLKTQKGATSPPFAYEGVNGETVTQEDLKGKLVYIDLWATWCGPCLREIPYFDTLQETFKDRDITFVSICQNDTKERWLKTVEIKNLRGLQLYAKGDGGQFYEDYQVTGIPRYIILDAEGKIIDSDAKRPSDKRLVAELEALLK